MCGWVSFTSITFLRKHRKSKVKAQRVNFSGIRSASRPPYVDNEWNWEKRDVSMTISPKGALPYTRRMSLFAVLHRLLFTSILAFKNFTTSTWYNSGQVVTIHSSVCPCFEILWISFGTPHVRDIRASPLQKPPKYVFLITNPKKMTYNSLSSVRYINAVWKLYRWSANKRDVEPGAARKPTASPAKLMLWSFKRQGETEQQAAPHKQSLS